MPSLLEPIKRGRYNLYTMKSNKIKTEKKTKTLAEKTMKAFHKIIASVQNPKRRKRHIPVKKKPIEVGLFLVLERYSFCK